MTDPDKPGHVLVCSPVRFGLPAAPSREETCGRCGAAVWVSRRAPMHPDYLCIVCAMAVVKPGDEIRPAPWVMDDLTEAAE